MPSYEQLSPQSRVWIYQSNRPLSPNEVENLQCELDEFAQQWTAHNAQLKALGRVLHGVFVVLMVDESATTASGCSIDKSVHFLKEAEQRYGISLFDRLGIAYLDAQQRLHLTDRSSFEQLYAQGSITDATPVFNNTVSTKAALEQHWILPIEQSWHRMLVMA